MSRFCSPTLAVTNTCFAAIFVIILGLHTSADENGSKTMELNVLIKRERYPLFSGITSIFLVIAYRKRFQFCVFKQFCHLFILNRGHSL